MPEPNTTSLLHQVESGRAQHAFQHVTKGYTASEKPKEFAASCKKLPMLIKLNGLVPALLFAREKSQFGHLDAYVMSWLKSDGSPVAVLLRNANEIGDLTSLDSRHYRQVAGETQRYLTWVKRFAAALRADDRDNDN